MKKKRIASFLLMILTVISISGCKNNGSQEPTTRPTTALVTTVALTTTPVTTVALTTTPVTTVAPTTTPITTVAPTTTPVATVAPTTLPETTTQPTTTTEEEESSEILYDEETPTKAYSPENDDFSYSSSEYGIFVDISTQELRYYEAGELILYSPVVTGDAYNSPTPMGNFWVNNKAQNTILYGDDYESHVEYWIAFLGSGYGFHDASWRDSFGGDIYLYDGSHGCINMPLSAVAELYSLVEIGTPVFIE